MRYLFTIVVMLLLTLGLASCRQKSNEVAQTPPSPGASQQTSTPATPTQPTTNPAPPAQRSAASPNKLGGTDWPNFLGPNQDGISPERGINSNWSAKAPKTLWTVTMSANSYAGPAVADGRVFIIDHQGSEDIIRALDMNSGTDLWKFSYADAAHDNYGFGRATPTVSGGKVYTVSRQGSVYCLDAASGKQVWKRHLASELGGSAPQWDYSMSPLVDGNKVIVVPGGGNCVAALDAGTGRTLWQGGGNDIAGYATPVKANINGKAQYVVFAGKSLRSVDANSGALLWSVPWVTGCDVNAATPIIIGNSVFITSGYGHGCALVEVAGNSARIKWENKEMQSHFSSPILYNGSIYGTTDPGDLVCLDPNNGATKWRKGGFQKGGVVGVDGMLIAVSGNNGDTVLAKMDPGAYQELGRFTPLGGESWTAPVVANGRLLIRNKTKLACVELK